MRLYSYQIWFENSKRFFHYYDFSENEFFGIDRGQFEFGSVRFWHEDDAKNIANKWQEERINLGLFPEDMLLVFYIRGIHEQCKEVFRKKI